MSFASFRRSVTPDRSLTMARERLSHMTQDQLAAATPEGLVNSFGVSLEQAHTLLSNFNRINRRDQ